MDINWTTKILNEFYAIISDKNMTSVRFPVKYKGELFTFTIERINKKRGKK